MNEGANTRLNTHTMMRHGGEHVFHERNEPSFERVKKGKHRQYDDGVVQMHVLVAGKGSIGIGRVGKAQAMTIRAIVVGTRQDERVELPLAICDRCRLRS